jgi:hypothetical protein
VVESALSQSFADGVPPPHRLAIDDGGIAAHVLAGEKRHPHMRGL